MKIPTIYGVIRRRVLLNYRVDPDVMGKHLPSGSAFKLKLVDGYAIAGICLIRLEAIRPKGFPRLFGLSSENSAHRLAVEWQGDGGALREGVFVPRRDTNSLLNSIAGGRLFPGLYQYSRFEVQDESGKIAVKVRARDFNEMLVAFEAEEVDFFQESSVFESLEDSSRFFEKGCVGYSACPGSNKLEGVTLNAYRWVVSPLEVRSLCSAYFDDLAHFPKGSIEFDHALLMRDIPHEWQSESEMYLD